MNKKICLFIDTFGAGGAERVCINYANELTDIGYDVTILVFNLNKKFYITDLKTDVKVESLNVANGMWSFIKLLRKKKMLKNFEVFIAFNHQIALILYVIKKILGIDKPLVARNVNNLAMDLTAKKGNPLKRTLTRFLMRNLYNKMHAYIAQCNAMKEDMMDYYSLPQEKIEVIYNPISPMFKKIEMEKDIDVLFVGRLTQQKGIDNLIKIISQSYQELPNLHFYIVGQGVLQSELLSSLKSIGVNYTHDFQSNDLVNLYNRSKITILTSYYEGYPNVLVESIACGTPVISFDCKSGPSEIINNGVNGYLISNFDTDMFSNRLVTVLREGYSIESNNNNKLEIQKLKMMLEYLID